MSEYKKIWNKNHKKYFSGKVTYDNWLNEYAALIIDNKGPVIDLGCGTGNNTLYLLERKQEVIACDYSDEAIKIINEHFPKTKTIKFNMTEGFPFKKNFTNLIIADLCLHYFSI